MYCRHLTFVAGLLSLLVSIHASAQAQSNTAPINATAHVPLKIVLIGDSTMCDYFDMHTYRGLGQYMEKHFEEGTVKVFNLAANGRSSKTLFQEGASRKCWITNPIMF